MTDTPETPETNAPELPTAEGLAVFDAILQANEQEALRLQAEYSRLLAGIATMKLARVALVRTLTPPDGSQGSG